MPLSEFKKSLQGPDTIEYLRAGLIGEGIEIPGLDGPVKLVYADYVASGRALRQVEDFVTQHVLPFYANTHTETSYCGAYTSRLREEARGEIARLTNAGEDCAVIFAGSGATAGLNRLVSLLGIDKAQDPVVFIGPYEHHSNMLPWRESKARVIEIPEGIGGGPDLAALEAALQEHGDADLLIGSFSAASNVTGIVTDDVSVTRLLKKYGALSVWDYAGGGPYLAMDMGEGETAKDAIVTSPHKFPGGPGASGVLVLRKSAVARRRPSWPGGGTVSFVSPWEHSYLDDITAREEAGTPNIVGDIRAALVFLVKEAIGQEQLDLREEELNWLAKSRWLSHPQLTLLGCDKVRRLPIFSFLVTDRRGNPVHQQLFAQMLSDIYGIQTRGGCACAGPYGHRLLGIDQTTSERLRDELLAGHLLHKPGWVRLNFTALMDDATARYIIDSVLDLLSRLDEFVPRYHCDPDTAEFEAVA